jgi:hypothetical protein
MKTRIFLVAACLMLFASLSFGQGFSAFLVDANVPLSATCGGADYYADGTATLMIYWDANSNGPDAADVQPTVGDLAGNVNYNQFAINGDAQGIGTGFFASESDFVSVGVVPQPPRYYIRVLCSDGSQHWVSEVAVLASGPQEVYFTNWNCSPCAPPSCTPGPDAQIYAEGSNVPLNISICLDLCAGYATFVRICGPGGAPLDPTKPPVSHVAPGCDPASTDCDEQCPPGFGDVTGPTYDPSSGCWIYSIYGINDGCLCFTLERFLAVGFSNDFVAAAGDNEVHLTWSTSSEAEFSKFDIMRDGAMVGEVVAADAAHNYEYVDRAENGRTYRYSLVLVYENGGREELATMEATPSFSAAVVTEYALLQNFPNPFNPTTQIAFDVLATNPVTLKIYNAAGQEVATLLNGVSQDNGRHIINFDSGNLTTGIYFYTVKIGNEFSATKKMLLVK